MSVMNTENVNRFKCLIENDTTQEKETKVERNGNIEKHESNKKRNNFLEPKTNRFDFSYNDNNNNMFKKRREGFRKHYKGREDINSFSGKYKGVVKKEEEKPKTYCYKEEDFPSL